MPTLFNSWEEAKEAYYKTHQCDSDDTDKEDARIMEWIHENDHAVLE